MAGNSQVYWRRLQDLMVLSMYRLRTARQVVPSEHAGMRAETRVQALRRLS